MAGQLPVVLQLEAAEPAVVDAGITDAESYGYSLAGLLLSIALLLAGVRLPDKALRLAGLVPCTSRRTSIRNLTTRRARRAPPN